MGEINIPQIYEENIIAFIYDGVNVHIKYYYENMIVNLNFNYVYSFDFCDFDYFNDSNWNFGLVESDESSILKDLFSRIHKDKIAYAFGGEADKIRHYKLVIDEVGIYNIVCKGFVLEQKKRKTLLD